VLNRLFASLTNAGFYRKAAKGAEVRKDFESPILLYDEIEKSNGVPTEKKVFVSKHQSSSNEIVALFFRIRDVGFVR
jgi:hypothetical protein